MLAGALARLGVRSRDRVAYLGVHDIAVFETFFAAGLLGAIFVPLNYRLSDRDPLHARRQWRVRGPLIGR